MTTPDICIIGMVVCAGGYFAISIVEQLRSPEFKRDVERLRARRRAIVDEAKARISKGERVGVRDLWCRIAQPDSPEFRGRETRTMTPSNMTYEQIQARLKTWEKYLPEGITFGVLEKHVTELHGKREETDELEFKVKIYAGPETLTACSVPFKPQELNEFKLDSLVNDTMASIIGRWFTRVERQIAQTHAAGSSG